MGKKAAIWVSTVLYILITLAVLGIAYAAIKPRIDEMRDKAIIEQSITMLDDLDETIREVKEVEGTRRQIEIQLKQGTLIFECVERRVSWQYASAYKYSEIDRKIAIGNLYVLTKESRGGYNVTLSVEYGNDFDITFGGSKPIKRFTPAEVDYIFFIENKAGKIDIYNV